MIIKKIVLFVLFCLPNSVLQADILDFFGLGSHSPASKIHVAVGVADQQQRLEALNEEVHTLQDQAKIAIDDARLALEREMQNINQVEQDLKKAENSEYQLLQKIKARLNESHHVLNTIPVLWKQLISSLEQHIKVLEEYLKDPQFKILMLDVKSVSSFEDLQGASSRLAEQDERIARLEEEKSNAIIELRNKEKNAAATQKAYKDKKKEQEELLMAYDEQSLLQSRLMALRAQLLDADLRYLEYKRQLEDLKVNDIKHRHALLESKLFIAKARRKVFEAQLIQIRFGHRVSEADVEQERQKLEGRRQDFLDARKRFYKEGKAKAIQSDQTKQELDQLASELSIHVADIKEFKENVFVPTTAQEYVKWSKIILLKYRIMLLDKQTELLDAHGNLAEQEFYKEHIKLRVMESWHKITFNRFSSEEEIITEGKQYIEPRQAVLREQALLKERRDSATYALTIQNKAMSSIKEQIKNLEQQRTLLFKNYDIEFAACRRLLASAYRMMSDQIELHGKLIELYSSMFDITANNLRLIDAITAELASISIWRRSGHAITLRGILAVPSDLRTFATDVVRLGGLFFTQLKQRLVDALTARVSGNVIIIWIIVILLVAVFLLALHISLPRIYALLLEQEVSTKGLRSFVGFIACIVQFVYEYLWSLSAWGIFWVLLRVERLDLFLGVLFYVASIPWLGYLAWKFVHHIADCNKELRYIFFSSTFQPRFISLVFPVLLFSIFVLCFREAFIMGSLYSRSELPVILLALYSIGIRIILVSLIRKEDILEFLPVRGQWWSMIREYIDLYYYPLLGLVIILVILSEPHIGFGSLISYTLWGTVSTLIVVRLLFIIHAWFKQLSLHLFFEYSPDSVKERFVGAKTWYGMYVIATFVIFIFIGVVVSARMWGYVVTMQQVSDLLKVGIFHVGVGSELREINILSLMELISFILGSFVLAFVVDHFVLQRIFDLLLIDAGIQYTISRLVHYFIVAVVTLFGLMRVGLGFLIPYVAAPLLIGFGWTLKDYANDFIAYFIILVQRPFKIGDFVRINDTTSGVVRRITPRMVMLRFQNSYTIFVPNSKVVSGQIANWSYTRTFIAFEDMFITVPYTADPTLVKELILQAMESNIHVLRNPRPIVWLNEFGVHGFVFLVRGFLGPDNVLNKWEISSEVRFAIVSLLRKHHIAIAEPIRRVIIEQDNNVSLYNPEKNL